jgi:hypothetical protein
MDTDDICLYGGRIAKARESMGTGPALGLLTTGGTPALGKFRERPTTLLTPSKLYSSAELTGSTKLARCWNDWYAVQSGSGQLTGSDGQNQYDSSRKLLPERNPKWLVTNGWAGIVTFWSRL